MKLIVGLGNPGEKYANNRHNVGFMFAEFLAEKLKGEKPAFKKDKYSGSETLQIDVVNDKLIVAKPQTYMNNSGVAVSKLMINNSILKENLIIAHDDLDIPLGIMHIQSGVGPQLHNGLESIEKHLKTRDFMRVRIGVDARTRENWTSGESYVLNDFKPEEKQILLEKVFPRIMELLEHSH
jgi:PTH1 family peptidyl-tRNA hydrolase